MSYLNQCDCVESFSPEHIYTFTGPCVITGEKVSVAIKAPELFAYNQGALAQNAFKSLDVHEREFVISGTSKAGWEKLFGKP